MQKTKSAATGPTYTVTNYFKTGFVEISENLVQIYPFRPIIYMSDTDYSTNAKFPFRYFFKVKSSAGVLDADTIAQV